MTGFRNLMTGAAGAAGSGGIAVDNSAIFNEPDDEYFTRTPSSASNQKTWTFSTWIKRGNLGSDQRIFTATNNGCELFFDANDKLNSYQYTSGSYVWNYITTQEFRDPHAWFHLVVRIDTTQASSGDRVRLYVNGEQITAFDTSTAPSQDATGFVNSTVAHYIGRYSGSNSMHYDGYLAETVLIDGSSLAPTSFGETDSNGVWRPVSVSGLTFGTNGFYLNFASSGADLGDDASGNSNDFTNTNSVTQSGDSPTTNHCGWSPLTMDLNASSSLALSSGNLVVSNTASEDTNVHGSFGLSAGKWYFEVTVDTINEIFLGVSDATIASNANAKTEAGAFVLDLKNANKYNNDGGSSYGSAFTNGDVANVALDLDNGKIWIGKDGTYPNSGNPATGSNEMYSGISGTFFPFLSTQGGGTKQGTTNFGQSSFTTSAPTGFEPLNTAKLYENAAPTIEDGSAYHQTSIWQGNTTARKITQDGNSTFKPDFLWCKNRDNAGYSFRLFDAVRGNSKLVQLGGTAGLDAESTDTNGQTDFEVDGFDIGNGVHLNDSGDNIVGWQWLAGNGTSTPSGGSVSSTVSVNQTAGFSIVSWTGTGANATVAHGLGATPQVVIVKNRSVSSGWYVGHASAGFNYELRLDENGVRAGSATLFNETNPTSTVFTVGTAAGTNGSTNNMIAYCWAEKEGYSKFGSYVGNGNANGPFVETGFSPSWIMFKRITGSVASWAIYDNARDSRNAANKMLLPDSAAGDNVGNEMDWLSNGVKIKGTSGAYNGSSNTYIYMAFAEHPFAGTTPATAR